MNPSILLLFLFFLPQSDGQSPKSSPPPPPPPTSNGYNCSADRSIYPCQSYAFYRVGSYSTLPDLPSIADIFSLSRLTVARASNLTANSTLLPNQPLLIPLTCGCNFSISYSPTQYQISFGDTYYRVASFQYGNLTSYPAVITVNPTLVPTNLTVGVEVVFPIFCQCPPARQNATKNNSIIITYTFQPGDTYSSIAAEFGTDEASIVALNGPQSKATPYLTILIPVPKVPPPVILNSAKGKAANSTSLTPPVSTVIVQKSDGRKGAVIGLAVALGLVSFTLLMGLCWVWRGGYIGKRRRRWVDEERVNKFSGGGGGGGVGVKKYGRSLSDEKLMNDISEWLDKYKVYGIEELITATGGFDESKCIEGSVYKGVIDGEVYAIKKMKWNAFDELKILQKVNHTNLVKLEGFCIEPDAATCYLVYEYVENGSLHSWLQDPVRSRSLDWRARLRIALDLAHGLQYIHEHTWPRVVHKDIKSSNVLLDSKMRAKIANFGLAKTGCNAFTTNIVGTQGYVAPEYLVDGLVSTKMDVFAYGVVLLQLLSGREAASGDGAVLWMEVENIYEKKDGRIEGRVLEWIDRSILEERSGSVDSVINVMSIARACLNKDPAKRPSMVDVAYSLSKSDEMYSDFSEDGLPVGSGDVVAR